MGDIVNDYFRSFYPPDWETGCELENAGMGYWRRYRGAHQETHDIVFPRMVCADGLAMSVQGHFGAYSQPREDFAEQYHSVEVLAPNGIIELEPYQDCEVNGEMNHGYVPVDVVAAIVEKHGGLLVREHLEGGR